MKKVCLIMPYFGAWPPYFNLFLKGCEHNPELNILFFTDLTPPSSTPENVTFHHCTLEQIKLALDEIIGFECALLTPYKLCDFRPVYGLVFKTYIRQFDFWGWGDIDVIYGRIKESGLYELLRNHDIVSFRGKWLSGSFCLVRNDDTLNKLFFNGNNLSSVFSVGRYMGFDEISFCWHEARTALIDDIVFPSDNFTRIVMNAYKQALVVPFFGNYLKESIPRFGFVQWNDGRITDQDGKGYLVYHYITEKRKAYFKYPKWESIPAKFFIEKTGFYNEREYACRGWIRCQRIVNVIPKMMTNYVFRIVEGLGRRLARVK